MILVDTDVLVEHLRGRPAATDWLLGARSRTTLVISVVSLAELTGGMRSHERAEVTRLLAALRPRTVDEDVARRAGELRRTYRRSHSGIALPDYLIAATAQLDGLELATRNLRHFPMFPGLMSPF